MRAVNGGKDDGWAASLAVAASAGAQAPPLRGLALGLMLRWHHCRGPGSAGLRVPEGWTAQAKNEGSVTKFDAGERPALVVLTELSESNQALFL